jgi:mycothiol synthase
VAIAEQYAHTLSSRVDTISLRAPTLADTDEIARMVNAHDVATAGVGQETPAGVAEWFDLSELDPAQDMRVAVGAGGRIVGYGDVADEGGLHQTFPIDLRVHPDAAEAAPVLLDALEARARAQAQAGAVMRLFVNTRDHGLRVLAEERGYRVVRSSYRMVIDLQGDLVEPMWPAGVTPRAYKPEDEARVYETHQEAFEDHWGFARASLEQWRAWNLGATSDPSLWTVAWDGDEIAGVCINRPERGDATGWIGVLAVRAPWRRRGLGRALLLDAFRTFRRIGYPRAGLGVDAENTTGAVRLYESAGMTVASRFDTWERPV